MTAVNFRPSTVSVVPVSLDEAREWVTTARGIIDRMDGKQPTEADVRDTLTDAVDLAFSILGTVEHVNARDAERRARAIAGV